MPQIYLDQLVDLMKRVGVGKNTRLVCKHFFGGAACWVNGKIFASFSSIGFALKLPERERTKLMKNDDVKPLQYFPKAPIKKEYVVLPKRMLTRSDALEDLVKISIDYVLG